MSEYLTWICWISESVSIVELRSKII